MEEPREGSAERAGSAWSRASGLGSHPRVRAGASRTPRAGAGGGVGSALRPQAPHLARPRSEGGAGGGGGCGAAGTKPAPPPRGRRGGGERAAPPGLRPRAGRPGGCARGGGSLSRRVEGAARVRRRPRLPAPRPRSLGLSDLRPPQEGARTGLCGLFPSRAAQMVPGSPIQAGRGRDLRVSRVSAPLPGLMPTWTPFLCQAGAEPGLDSRWESLVLKGDHKLSSGGSAPLVDIVGGRKARPQELPFLASIQNQGRHFCGGALIHPNFVLTAASCFQSRNTGIATVVLGAYDLRRRERSRQTFFIRSVSENGYDPQQNLNDVLLLQLDRQANLTSSVALVPLPEQNATVEAGTGCQVAGWGTRRRRGRLSRVPRVLNVTVTPANQCRPNNVCTGVLTRRGGICQGDGGTPLVCNGLAHGVASWSRGPCGRGTDFFARVALFRNWIDSVINQPA
uniref:Azurocidin n=1 Tax=Bos taurus TaxID=9913 RepID=A0AAA9RU90_BOVIN